MLKFFSKSLIAIVLLFNVVNASSQPLKIGDTIPEDFIAYMMSRQTGTASSPVIDNKLIILDFWATWCNPCIYMIPRMDSLQRQFNNQIQFFSITSQTEKEVAAFLEKYRHRYQQELTIPHIVADTLLRKKFPHRSLPHYVWIGQNGVVRAITGMDEINGPTILGMLQSPDMALKEKQDEKQIPYDKEKPLLVNGNGGDGSKLRYHSLLTDYTPGLTGGFSWNTDSLRGRKITLTNCSRLWFFKIAYAKPGSWFSDQDVAIEVSDPGPLTSALYGQNFLDWMMQNNGFCYELIVPLSFPKNANILMQEDVSNFFPEYVATVESRMKRCLALTLLDKDLLKKSSGGKPDVALDPFGWKVRNASLRLLIDRINKMQDPPIPLVDETGMKTPIDLDIAGRLSDLDLLNKELRKHGLILIEKDREQQVLVIRDKITI